MKNNYYKTIYACFLGYIVQAIINNFAPLLFLTFHSSYGIPLTKITLLITINFVLQLVIDFLSAGFIDKIGYRVSIVIAHICSAFGLILLAILPDLTSDPYHGLFAAVMVYAVGGGLLEVLVSPIMEACPTPHKAKAMSMLHSFYCWGHVGVVLFSAIFFYIFGIEHWKILAVMWALVPIANTIAFTRVPIASLHCEDEKGLTILDLAKKKLFWILLLLMICAGASEQAFSQWASTFAESSLGIQKTIGDLAGPMLFAIFMGTSRLFYGKYGDRIHLEQFMYWSALLCILTYLILSLSPWPILGLIGGALCGLSVGIFWPGTFSLAAKSIRGGGTAMFALLALGGDVGCAGGPTYVGMISSALKDNLKIGLLAAIVFPIVLIAGMKWRSKYHKN